MLLDQGQYFSKTIICEFKFKVAAQLADIFPKMLSFSKKLTVFFQIRVQIYTQVTPFDCIMISTIFVY